MLVLVTTLILYTSLSMAWAATQDGRTPQHVIATSVARLGHQCPRNLPFSSEGRLLRPKGARPHGGPRSDRFVGVISSEAKQSPALSKGIAPLPCERLSLALLAMTGRLH